MYSSNCTHNRQFNGNLMSTGARFTVVCKRCKNEFDVIRNFGGGVRLAGKEQINPAKCPSCNSMSFELY